MATLNKSMKAMKTKAYHDNSLEIPVIKIQNQQTTENPKVLIVENLSVESSKKLDSSKIEDIIAQNQLHPQSLLKHNTNEYEPKIKSFDTIKSNKILPITNKSVSFLAPPLPPTRFHQRSMTSSK